MTIVVEADDPDGYPHLGDRDFNPNHPRRLFLTR